MDFTLIADLAVSASQRFTIDPNKFSHHSRQGLWRVIQETVAGDFSRFDYAATGNKAVGCEWLTRCEFLNDER
jgi:hypothetical protein